MKELPHDLYKRCLDLLEDCREFESDENLRAVFNGQEIEGYSRFVKERNTPSARIEECVGALKKKSNKGRSILALFLETIARRYPEGDDSRTALEELAREISSALELTSPPFLPPPQSTNNTLPTVQTPLETQKQEVLVIWGKEDVAKIEIFEFLRGAGLSPVEWSEVERRTSKNSPPVDDVLQTAFDTMKAVVVLFTGDDLVISKIKDFEYEKKPDSQPTPDILFKAGVALGIDSTKTILVALGRLRLFGNILDRHIIQLTNKDEDRGKFISRLEIAGCIPTKRDWTFKGNFNNRGFYRASQIEITVTMRDDLR